jgi:Short C-terminal domain
MNDAAELIRAIAALIWPAIVIFLLWAYKPEVVSILRRLRLLTTETASNDDVVSKLERLARLKADGILTEDEFQVEKQQILSRQ